MNHELLIITILGLTAFIFSIATVYLMVANERLKKKYYTQSDSCKVLLIASAKLSRSCECKQREIDNLKLRILKAQNEGYCL